MCYNNKTMKKRVVVAMSGGVDSAVAAALLKKQGYQVIGMTMCFNLADSPGKKPGCCGWEGIEDARRVAFRLGIRHYLVNAAKVLREKVIRDFCREYLKGRTPNPCVWCNQYIKFDFLLRKALALGAQYLATGHYARIVKIPQANSKIKKYALKKAKDLKKDQSYFLYRLGQEQLKHIIFPLGGYTKPEVRVMAREFGLPVADKPGSQEICFLADNDYRSFLKRESGDKIKPGPILDKEGNILGRHAGIAFYTVGQREGLGIARGYPLYVTAIDPRHNTIQVAGKADAYSCEFLVAKAHFILKPPKKKVALRVRIRYNHREAPAELFFSKGRVKVKFKQPQFAITPGQSAVFYQRDTLVGGGVIERVLA